MSRSIDDLLSPRVRSIASSVTLEISAVAARLKAEGKKVIAFGAGEPDLLVPVDVQEAGIAAIRSGLGKYTAVPGIAPLREAVAQKFQADGFPFSVPEVMVTAGAKPALYLAFYSLLAEGDECLIPAPFWSSYTEMVKAVGGEPRTVPTRADNDFQPDPQAIRAALTPKTRMLLLNSPNNPTGTVYSKDTLAALATIVRERDLVVVSDDIYEKLIYTDEPYTNILHVAPDLRDRVIVINGLSKSHSMTGWRMGFVGGPEGIVRAMTRAQSQIVGSPPAITQHAAVQALRAPLDPRRQQIFDERRNAMMSEIRRLPGVTCPEPRGAFYAFPDVSSYLGRTHRGRPVPDATAFCRFLLEDHLVATVTGDAFGGPGHLRLTYCCSPEEIQEGMRRIRQFLSEFDA